MTSVFELKESNIKRNKQGILHDTKYPLRQIALSTIFSRNVIGGP